MKTSLFESFAEIVNELPAAGILKAVELEHWMLENDLLYKRVSETNEVTSILNFCQFIKAVADEENILPVELPTRHVAFFRQVVTRLIKAGELPMDDRYFLVQSFKQRERVIVIDPANTFYVSPLLKFEEAKALHVEQSTLAATAFLERNPKGFDNDDLLKQMFLKQAYQKASAYQFAEQPEFKSKQLHQKVEISGINILNTREDFVLTQVTGQLIRDGVFEDKPFTEAIPFKLSLRLQRNPNMVQNGRFPTAVNDFKYETTGN